jgi:asparagine synthase (glutamine-hydrolysing)
MCGIAGIVDKRRRYSAAQLSGIAEVMASGMAHRGPDDSGVWVSPDGQVALSHRRLSIIDTSPAGHQPMLTADGRQAITFNGEIYNFLELRGQLEASGVAFRSRSDTEVLLALLRRDGRSALPQLDAMFAFGYYDVDAQALILARDIFGEKPLYYFESDEVFAFASELSALTKVPGFDPSIDRDTIAAYLAFQYVPAPRTIYRAACKLPPGSFLVRKNNGDIEVASFFRFEASSVDRGSRSTDDLADELESILIASIKRRLISDVPLGAFLSGGVDSSTVAAIAVKKLGEHLKTFSIGFDGYEDSEHAQAADVAKLLGTDHHERILTPDAIDMGRHVGAAIDEPNADSSCLPTFLLSAFARERVTVALSGDGGDEMFGGYGRYFVTVDEWARKVGGHPPYRGWSAGSAYISNRIMIYTDDVLRRAIGGMPPRLASMLYDLRRSIDSDPRPLLNVLREVDARTYLPGAVLAKVDRMSMQHSLEVRAPLLGKDVAAFAMRLAANDCYHAGSGKVVLKRLASRYLPEAWMNRPKRGFGLPMTLWSADRLLPITRDLLLAPDARLTEWIDRSKLASYLDASRTDFNAYRIWALFILETWLRAHPAKPVAGDDPLDDTTPLTDRVWDGLKRALRAAGIRRPSAAAH